MISLLPCPTFSSPLPAQSCKIDSSRILEMRSRERSRHCPALLPLQHQWWAVPEAPATSLAGSQKPWYSRGKGVRREFWGVITSLS